MVAGDSMMSENVGKRCVTRVKKHMQARRMHRDRVAHAAVTRHGTMGSPAAL